MPKLYHDLPSKYVSLKRDRGHEWVNVNAERFILCAVFLETFLKRTVQPWMPLLLHCSVLVSMMPNMPALVAAFLWSYMTRELSVILHLYNSDTPDY